MPTVLSLLRWSTEVFKTARIDSPRLTAELLLCHLLDCDRLRLYVDFEKILQPEETDRFVEMVRRRTRHEPVQYITGESVFMGLRFYVDRNVLIPRPETEVLVEETLAFLRKGPSGPKYALDVGTGSGNICVSMARFMRDLYVLGIDVSGRALALAARNIDRYILSGRVGLARMDALRERLSLKDGSFHAVVSNPPYIPLPDVPGLDAEVRLYEPHIATTDSADGLTFFRRLAECSRTLLVPGGMLAVETGYNQGHVVSRIFAEQDFRDVRIIPDLSGVGRVVTGVK